MRTRTSRTTGCFSYVERTSQGRQGTTNHIYTRRTVRDVWTQSPGSRTKLPSGIEIYHSLYKELTPHTMMNRLKAAQNMVNTSTLDGKIDLRGPPTRFITKIRESMRQYKTLYKRECLRESLVCDLLLLRLPRTYDGVVKRLGVKPPETELTLLMVQ